MARPSIFVGTPSIFESLRLKQIYLYFKTIITNVLHIDLTFYDIIFWAISGDNDVTIVLALNRIAALIGIFVRNEKCLKLPILFLFRGWGGGAVKEWEDGEGGGEAINRGTAIIRGNAVVKKATLGVPASGWR